MNIKNSSMGLGSSIFGDSTWQIDIKASNNYSMKKINNDIAAWILKMLWQKIKVLLWSRWKSNIMIRPLTITLQSNRIFCEPWLWKSNQFLATSEGNHRASDLLSTEYSVTIVLRKELVTFQDPHPYCVKYHVLIKMRTGYKDQPYPRKCGSKYGYPLAKHHVRLLAPGPWPVPPIAITLTNQISYIAYVGRNCRLSEKRLVGKALGINAILLRSRCWRLCPV